MITIFSVFLEQLRSENVVSQSFRFAKGTAQNMVSGIRTWFTYCVYYSQAHIPARAESLVPFLQLMSLTVTYAHLKHLVSAIKFYHQAKNADFPEHNFEERTCSHGVPGITTHACHHEGNVCSSGHVQAQGSSSMVFLLGHFLLSISEK